MKRATSQDLDAVPAGAGQAAAPGNVTRQRGRPKLEDAAALQDRLLAVALREFVNNGYGGTSMSQIIRAAQVSKTTLYSRYSSKEDLFRAIMQRQIERLGAGEALKTETGQPDLAAGLKAYANRALAFSLQGDLRDIHRLVYSESHRFSELGAATVESTQIGIDCITQFIRHCAVVDGITCRKPRTVAETFILAMRGWSLLTTLEKREIGAAERETWVERTVELLLAGRANW